MPDSGPSACISVHLWLNFLASPRAALFRQVGHSRHGTGAMPLTLHGLLPARASIGRSGTARSACPPVGFPPDMRFFLHGMADCVGRSSRAPVSSPGRGVRLRDVLTVWGACRQVGADDWRGLFIPIGPSALVPGGCLDFEGKTGDGTASPFALWLHPILAPWCRSPSVRGEMAKVLQQQK